MARPTATLALAGVALFFLLSLPSAGAATLVATDDRAFNPRFEPTELTAAVGETIEVRSTGADRHTVTATDGGWPEVELGPGETRSFRAPAQTGAFRFYCRYHASPQAAPGDGMAGLLRVASGDAPPAGPPSPPPPRATTPDAGALLPLAVLAGALFAARRRHA